jgi:hypothetical protein
VVGLTSAPDCHGLAISGADAQGPLDFLGDWAARALRAVRDEVAFLRLFMEMAS